MKTVEPVNILKIKTEYDIVSGIQPNALANIVDARMEAGWALIGQPFAFNGNVHQAMTRQYLDDE